MIRREKEEALHALDDRMKKIKEIEKMLNRVEAQLASTAGALDSVLADIMRLQALGGTQAEREVPKIVQQIRGQLKQLKASEAEAASMV
jgi:ABC-type transporter Mla subunit MlaD